MIHNAFNLFVLFPQSHLFSIHSQVFVYCANAVFCCILIILDYVAPAQLCNGCKTLFMGKPHEEQLPRVCFETGPFTEKLVKQTAAEEMQR